MNKVFTLTPYTFVFIIAIAFTFSCQKEQKKLAEISLERWTVEGDSTSYEKGNINYLEKVLYNEDGRESGKLLYNVNKQLEAKEIRIFDESTGVLKGSQYKNATDSLLSYYTFKINLAGNIEESKAFDASNDELLRIERFEYDKRNYPIKKMVFDAYDNPIRIFNYTVDKMGNELQVQVLTGDEKLILTEVFRITEYDSEKRWTEKWGFVEDQPFSYLARKVKYQ